MQNLTSWPGYLVPRDFKVNSEMTAHQSNSLQWLMTACLQADLAAGVFAQNVAKTLASALAMSREILYKYCVQLFLGLLRRLGLLRGFKDTPLPVGLAARDPRYNSCLCNKTCFKGLASNLVVFPRFLPYGKIRIDKGKYSLRIS